MIISITWSHASCMLHHAPPVPELNRCNIANNICAIDVILQPLGLGAARSPLLAGSNLTLSTPFALSQTRGYLTGAFGWSGCARVAESLVVIARSHDGQIPSTRVSTWS